VFPGTLVYCPVGVGHVHGTSALLVTDTASHSVAPIRLVVTDDHPVVLQGLQSLFATSLEFKVMAACETGEQTIAAVREHRPDVLVLDLRMRGLDGLAVLRVLKDEAVSVRVVILTAEIDDDQTLEALRLGAVAIVLKEMAPRLLMECVRKVHAGERWIERQSVGRALDTLLRREAGVRQLTRALTGRELDIVQMIVLGLRNAEIAERLHVSEGTVKSHLHHVYEKLGVKSRMALMRLAQQKGLK
jgi:DNA-binding NarL/FixJ family response regulator